MPLPPLPPLPRDAGLCWIDGARLAALAAEQTDAHRLASSREAWVERFGEDVLISYQRENELDLVRRGLARWRESHAIPVRRVFGRFLPRQNEERSTPVLLEGDASLPPTGVAMEGGLRYTLDFAAGYSVGLFIDQRANRAFLRTTRVRRLLNTFAYTCAFSVAAAASGATTLSVDLSRKSLDRGRENFALNGLEASAHRFIADDVIEVLPRLVRRGDEYDAIILDPPTYGKGRRARPFRVEHDLPDLLGHALDLAARDAFLLISTNCTRLGPRDLERMATGALKVAMRAWSGLN